MTSPEVIFTICRRTTASSYHILKSLVSEIGNLLVKIYLMFKTRETVYYNKGRVEMTTRREYNI